MFVMEGRRLSLYPRRLLAKDAAMPDDGNGFSGVTRAQCKIESGCRRRVPACCRLVLVPSRSRKM
jgi:hypothetical protein